MANRFWFYRSQLSCDAVVIMNSYAEKSDVSGNMQGVVCEGNLCQSRWICEDTSCRPDIPGDIDRFEMNTDFGHYSKCPNVPSSSAIRTLFPRLISAFGPWWWDWQMTMIAIYKTRNWNMYDVQDKVVGKCTPTDQKGFTCMGGVPALPISAKSLFGAILLFGDLAFCSTWESHRELIDY